jgi:hypothetical protein
MTNTFEFLDYAIFIGYALLILGVGLWVSRDKKGHEKNAEDYFLASKSLPWWAVGASLIAANISAEQFIGMSGSGFKVGLAIASYEWMGALTLIIVGKYFLPIFIEKGLYTIPEFVEKRFSTNLKTIGFGPLPRVSSPGNDHGCSHDVWCVWFSCLCGCLFLVRGTFCGCMDRRHSGYLPYYWWIGYNLPGIEYGFRRGWIHGGNDQNYG